MSGMSRAERADLAKVARLRARVARSAVAQREAELLAHVEDELATEYRFDHEAWADVVAHAHETVKAADAQIAQRCRELGIRPEFRPSIATTFYRRGENANAERRGELRKAAKARVEALGRAARAEIEAREAQVLTELYADGLESDAAVAFLASIPTPQELMPELTVAQLEADARPPRALTSD